MIQIEPSDYCDDEMAGLEINHKKRQMLLHVTAVKRHISPIDMFWGEGCKTNPEGYCFAGERKEENNN